jgi:hypothetical protein
MAKTRRFMQALCVPQTILAEQLGSVTAGLRCGSRADGILRECQKYDLHRVLTPTN